MSPHSRPLFAHSRRRGLPEALGGLLLVLAWLAVGVAVVAGVVVPLLEARAPGGALGPPAAQRAWAVPGVGRLPDGGVSLLQAAPVEGARPRRAAR